MSLNSPANWLVQLANVFAPILFAYGVLRQKILDTGFLINRTMVHRADVTGFMALGRKPSGSAWRPDEIELLGWASHHIGLDLYALKVEHLEQANSILAIRLEQAMAMVAGR